jgi:DNA-binding MarR family transcriptional regulator
MMRSMARHLPLPTLLSFALVAFTIEFDNEAEHRLPHRTTNHNPNHGSSPGSAAGPWLVSMAMFFNCMRWVPEQGIAVRELERLARTGTNWHGMQRWGYVYLEPSPDDNRPKPPQSAIIVRATSKGRMAQKIWTDLLREIEQRWRERLGADAVDKLRGALASFVSQLDPQLPDCLPILKYGLVNEGPKPQKVEPNQNGVADLPFPGLPARVLLAFALEFERESEVSLAICANVLRVVDEEGTAVREIPALSGVSKEGIAMALTLLTKRGFAKVLPAPSPARTKIVLLTPRGVQARADYPKLQRSIESHWIERYGEKVVAALRSALEPMVGDGTREASPLFGGLDPYPESWRARLSKPKTLPHYPMVLHRGGYPDGS